MKNSFMSNEEILDELLHEAFQLKIRDQVLDLSRTLREKNSQMTMLESVELAMDHIKRNYE
jgi:hypothetical protein